MEGRVNVRGKLDLFQAFISQYMMNFAAKAALLFTTWDPPPSSFRQLYVGFLYILMSRELDFGTCLFKKFSSAPIFVLVAHKIHVY